MKMYRDKNKQHPIEHIDFEEVKIGASKDVTVYLENDSGRELVRLEYRIKGPGKLIKDIKILLMSNNMLPDAIVPLTLRWKPSLDLNIGLRVNLEIKGEMIFRG